QPPPRPVISVEYMSPYALGSNRQTYPQYIVEPVLLWGKCVSKAPGVTGNAGLVVTPLTNTDSKPSRARSHGLPFSSPVDAQRYVDQTSPFPDALNRVTNPPRCTWNGMVGW